MNNSDFSTTMVVGASPATVFNAINNVRGWWSQNVDGATDVLNSEFDYHYQDVHLCKMKITELVPDKRVVWDVLHNYFKFTADKSEWIGDKITFEISEKDGKTQLQFTQKGLTPAKECYHVCHDAWTHYIQDSLKQLILTGEGKATPKDDGEYLNEDAIKETSNLSTGKSICHRLLIAVPVETVYEALTTQKGLAGWWTPDARAQPLAGSISTFGFGDYYKEIEVTGLRPYSSVKWKVLKGHNDWVGTIISFTLEAHRKGCILSFEHAGWEAYTPGFASCSYDWALFFRSLKLLCETGTGLPFPEFNR
jgi:uncharacterized protein YndB with AHSA1/START domain